MPKPPEQQLSRRWRTKDVIDTRKPIGKCLLCETPVKTELKGRMICFECYDKDMRATFKHDTSICLTHRRTYDLATGCPQCATVKK